MTTKTRSIAIEKIGLRDARHMSLQRRWAKQRWSLKSEPWTFCHGTLDLFELNDLSSHRALMGLILSDETQPEAERDVALGLPPTPTVAWLRNELASIVGNEVADSFAWQAFDLSPDVFWGEPRRVAVGRIPIRGSRPAIYTDQLHSLPIADGRPSVRTACCRRSVAELKSDLDRDWTDTDSALWCPAARRPYTKP
jgi:hypothetical protein